jgi:predicted nucleic acid-binding protein
VRALADTSILLAAVKPGEPEPDLGAYTDGVAVAALSWAELNVGLHVTQELALYKKRQAEVAALREMFPVTLPFDDACAAQHEKILARVSERGGTVKAHRTDRMIAAVAAANGVTLVTRNLEDFKGLEGIVDVAEA